MFGSYDDIDPKLAAKLAKRCESIGETLQPELLRAVENLHRRTDSVPDPKTQPQEEQKARAVVEKATLINMAGVVKSMAVNAAEVDTVVTELIVDESSSIKTVEKAAEEEAVAIKSDDKMVQMTEMVEAGPASGANVSNAWAAGWRQPLAILLVAVVVSSLGAGFIVARQASTR